MFTDAETTPDYGNRKNCYNCQRSVRDYPFKKRKLYDRCSLSNSDGGLSSDVISSLPGQGSNGDGFGMGPTKHGGLSSSTSHFPLLGYV